MIVVILSKFPVPAKSVIGRKVSEEAVIVLADRGEVKVLNEVGGRIWALADGSRTIGEIAAIISKEYNVTDSIAQADTIEFIHLLVDKDVLSLANYPVNTAS